MTPTTKPRWAVFRDEKQVSPRTWQVHGFAERWATMNGYAQYSPWIGMGHRLHPGVTIRQVPEHQEGSHEG